MVHLNDSIVLVSFKKMPVFFIGKLNFSPERMDFFLQLYRLRVYSTLSQLVQSPTAPLLENTQNSSIQIV